MVDRDRDQDNISREQMAAMPTLPKMVSSPLLLSPSPGRLRPAPDGKEESRYSRSELPSGLLGGAMAGCDSTVMGIGLVGAMRKLRKMQLT